MTNQLFRELLDGHIPMPRRKTPAQAIQEAAASMGMSVEALTEVLGKLAEAASKAIPTITKPAPTPPWAGNIATQKRRKRL